MIYKKPSSEGFFVVYNVSRETLLVGGVLETNPLIEQYLDLILEANKVTNLTRITSKEEGMILHIEDSLAGLEEINVAPAGLYGDLGTGGGFPGVPLAIVTGRKTVLVDSVQKKIKILSEIVEQLGLSNQISTYAGRIEDLAEKKRGTFSVLTARALSQLGSLLELSSPLLKNGGRLICYKANISEEEFNHALELQKKLAMKFVSRKDFVLSDGITHRCLIVFEKNGKPEIKLPRKMGFAQKRPL